MSHSNRHPLHNSLVKQLTFIDEKRVELQDLYKANAPNPERNHPFFDVYVNEVEKFLVEFDQQANSSLPKVFIGSQVSVVFEEDNFEDQFTIGFPEQSDPDRGYISVLSPLGRQLLLRSIDEVVPVSTPNGETRVVIRRIDFKDYQ